MYISARERRLLEVLFEQEDEITVKKLATEMDVSERTIHRDIKNIERTLENYSVNLIKKAGVGIQLVGAQSDIEELRMALYKQSHNEYTPEERQTMILCMLLESNEPVKLISLANDLNVTVATVSNDISKLEKKLKGINLSITRKRGYGIEIIGQESAKRNAMSKLIAENIDEVEFLSLVRESIEKKSLRLTDSISEKLMGLVEKKKLVIVEKAVEEINKELGYLIADSAYIGLVVHLALAIERIQQGEKISIDPDYLQSMQNTPEFKIAEKISTKLSTVFHLNIPRAEVGYITMHLHGAKVRHDKEYPVESSNAQISDKVHQLIKYVSDHIDTDLTNNFSLFQGLVTHLTPALYRIEQNMGIHNPLLAKIKEDYSQLFHVVDQGVRQLFKGLKIPDEEIGFIVLHFGSALMGEQHRLALKALVICSTGIGTSKLLATRLKREIPEIKDYQNVSLFELNQLDHTQFDLVLSTIKLAGYKDNYLLVSPMLSDSDIKKIEAFIDETYRAKINKPSLFHSQNNSRNRDLAIKTVMTIKQYSETALSILEGFCLKSVSHKININDALQFACQELYGQKRITDSKRVVQALIEREKLGGLGITNTKLALFHARSSDVLEPSFMAVRLNYPIKVNSMDQTTMKLGTILILLAPEQLMTVQLEILSYISVLIIESKESTLLFETADERALSSFISKKLENFLFEKINEMRSV